MKYYLAAIALTFFATIKVIADVFGFQQLSAVAAVTNVAPAMKVFTAHKGYETYSSRFELTVDFDDGQTITIELKPENYAGLKGPYNRRNVYGALIAYGPVLVKSPITQPMWNEMSQRAFCGEASVLSELGFKNTSPVKNATIRYLGQVTNQIKKQHEKASDYPNQLSIFCV
ncbi:MAG: hypothetical protein V3V50_04050 [Gammaproteobacteria bacterium]